MKGVTLYKECDCCHLDTGQPELIGAIMGVEECQNCRWVYEVDYYTRRIILMEHKDNKALDAFFDLKQLLNDVPMTTTQRHKVDSELKKIKEDLEK